ncbi:MAG: alpha/beta hydrolase [Candidatus Nanoarchaeia archaeon]|nr:alpha/beta hydrolase [Candidatus Nanoarchaeia archaeon]MDD5741039.1 alpha/beta hydrolase [Candidatus Nanoarchaeia archaeon]
MEKRSLALRIILSVILGFLPSFLFILMFVQYGSPFLNYIKFLSSLNVSWVAWISAAIIATLVFLVWGIVKSRKNFKKLKKNIYLLIIVILALFAMLILIAMQLYLYTQFLLGNDILIRLSADKNNIFFKNNTEEDVTFKISVTMNPFCIAQCRYEFFDISSGKSIETGSFNLTSVAIKSKTYTLNRNELIYGQSLNRFEISCKGVKSALCYTSGKDSERAILITLNYQATEEQSQLINNLKENMTSLGKNISLLSGNIEESKRYINLINNSFSADDLSQELANISRRFSELNSSFNELEKLWEIQDISLIQLSLPDINNRLELLNAEESNLSLMIISNTTTYNLLIENITGIRQILNNYSKTNLTAESCIELNLLIKNFNETISQFAEKSNISEKAIFVEALYLKINNFQNNLNTSNYACLTGDISENPEKIGIIQFNNSLPSFILKESSPICCFYGKCEKCCDENCSGKNYPVIFLHGHSINRALPADYSLDALAKIKKQLSYEGYIDAGAVLLSNLNETNGLWGEVNAPIEVTASYFFDVYENANGETTVQSNTDSIDTYAIRLKGIIDTVKYRTNKNKVIIVAHSMGGLVTRRYAQIFGGSEIDKAILITVPNHGIDKRLRDSCALLGPTQTCDEMDENSVFINKLNTAQTDRIKIYNIIGIGCSMRNETGDGIIKNSSQYLDYAVNYYVNGTCDEINFNFLHESIVDPKQYPKTYEIVNKTINSF